MSDTTADGDVLSLLGEERRLRIIKALAEHRASEPKTDPLSFSELFDRSEISDKGNFNYHLDRLQGSIVEKDRGGYDLTPFGEIVAGALTSGRYDPGETAVAIDNSCPICDSELSVVLDPGRTRVECLDGHALLGSCLPPNAGDDRAGADTLSTAVLHWQQVVELTEHGICAKCYGTEQGQIESVRTDDGLQYRYRTHCSTCGHGYAVPPWALVLRHPAVVSLFHDHGIDLRTVPYWELGSDWPPSVERVDDDPFRLAVTVERQWDGVVLVLDREGDVRSVDQTVEPADETTAPAK